jgi:alpha-1,2-mannosyltransferase
VLHPDLEQWLGDGRHTTVRRTALLVATTCVAFVAFWAAARGSMPYDFRIYRNAGEAVTDGQSPYPHLPLHHYPAGTGPFVYLLPAAWLYAIFAPIPFHVALWMNAALSIAAILAGIWLLGIRRPAVFALVLGTSIVLRGMDLGTVNGLLFLGTCALARWRDRPRVTGVIYVLLVALKPLMLPLIVYVLVTGRRTAGLTILATAGVLGVLSLVSGFSPDAYVRMLGELSRLEAGHGASLIHEITRTTHWSLGPTTLGVSAIGFAVLLATLVAGLAGRLDHRAVLAVSISVAILVSPIVWPHYFIFLLVPLLLLGRPTLVAAVACAVSWAVAPDATPRIHLRLLLPRPDQRPLVALLPLIALVVVAFVVLARRATPQR